MHTDNLKRFYEELQGSLAILTAYDEMQLSGDMIAPFLQDASFWWLTGISEPGWKLIIESSRRQATLARPARSYVDIVFNGESDEDAIRQVSGIENIISHDDFESMLRQLARKHSVVQTVIDQDIHTFTPNPAKRELKVVLGRIFDSVQDCTLTLNRLRAIKQPAEIERMQRAINLTVKAFRDVKEKLGELKSEAEFTYRFRRKSADHAYEPIVASGKNACVLHYSANSSNLSKRDMILIDIGARVDGYASDITRTYCLNPAARQRAVHAAVERAEQEIINLIRPGLPISEYLQKSDNIMKDALVTLGLIKNAEDETGFRRYFPHAISHGLGVDTHDSLGQPSFLEPGMVLTVEPGIYIPEEKIGVRIEDDVLVTETGCRNMSKRLPTSL